MNLKNIGDSPVNVIRINKKRENLYQLLFLFIEALALPVTIERATPKPHAV